MGSAGRMRGKAAPLNLSSYRRLLDESNSSIDTENNWMITLSDVMSLLLIFFIMFFIMTQRDAKSEETKNEPVPDIKVVGRGILPDADAVGERIRADEIGERIRDELTVDIRNLDMGDQISVLATNREVMITMKEKVAFTRGEAEVLAGSEPVLGTIAAIISKYPDFRVEIDGHTDNIPIKTTRYPSNWELSVARASSVLKYFITNHAIDPSRLSVRGNAHHKPIAPNDTPENRARNRRVEIRLKKIEA